MRSLRIDETNIAISSYFAPFLIGSLIESKHERVRFSENTDTRPTQGLLRRKNIILINRFLFYRYISTFDEDIFSRLVIFPTKQRVRTFSRARAKIKAKVSSPRKAPSAVYLPSSRTSRFVKSGARLGEKGK